MQTVKASLLFRLFNGTTPTGEASVSASTAPGTEFVTFAQTATGLAWANPSAQSSVVTISALSSAGTAGHDNLYPRAEPGMAASNIGSLLGISNFTGSIEVTATVRSLRCRSTLRPSRCSPRCLPEILAVSTALAGTGSQRHQRGDLLLSTSRRGRGYEAVSPMSTIRPTRSSARRASTATQAQYLVPFPMERSRRAPDSLNAGASIHISTTAAFTAAAVSGWAVRRAPGRLSQSAVSPVPTAPEWRRAKPA